MIRLLSKQVWIWNVINERLGISLFHSGCQVVSSLRILVDEIGSSHSKFIKDLPIVRYPKETMFL